MGGGSYDRDVSGSDSGSSSSGSYDRTAYSTTAETKFSRSSQDKSTRSLGRSLTCTHKHPIVCGVDVTGSMGDWPKVIWDKLPMFYGQIIQQGYLTDPAISFAAIGDAYADRAPLQVCDFAQSDDLDAAIESLWLEGGGGGQDHESYELMMHFYAHRVTFQKNAMRPILFITGDEAFFPAIEDSTLRQWIDTGYPTQTTEQIAADLKKIYDVFLLRKRYTNGGEAGIQAGWERLLGKQNVTLVEDPKSIIDLMLGIIAMVSKARSLEAYAKDMAGRGQSKARIKAVTDALKPLSDNLGIVPVGTGGLAKSGGDARKGSKRF
jgi:hypothetical protein